MTRLHRFVLFVAAAVAVPLGASDAQVQPVWPEEGPFKWGPRPTETAITANDLRTRLYQFADDSMMGRRIGEIGNNKGTDYIAREFERLGLRPGGDNGTWFQNLPWGYTGFDQAASQLGIQGQALRAGVDWIPLAPSGSAIGSKADLSSTQVVFAGRYGADTPLDRSAFRGKVAVFLGGPAAGGGRTGGASAPPSCADLPDRFGADAVIRLERQQRATAAAGSGRGGRGGGRGNASSDDTRALDAGAVAAIYVDLDSRPRGSVTSAFEGRGGLAPSDTPASTGLPAASITSAAATRLFGRPASQLAVGTTGRNLSARWSHEWRPGSVPARNVIAILPGSDPARSAEYVLVGAHNDHVGINGTVFDHDSLRAVNTVTRRQGANDTSCRPTADQQRQIDSLIARARSIRPPRPDSIMNGADDDGSGSMVMLEVAERFARERPARSIIFISHQGEEGGLRGSRWFVDHPTVPLDRIVAAINMDMVGKGRVSEVMFGGPTSVQMLGARRLSRDFGAIIDSVNAMRDEVMAIDRSWDVTANPLRRFCRSDQVNYVRKNVPVVYASLGYSQDYHQVTDEPQYIDYDHAAVVGRFVYDIMAAVAARRDRPRIDGPDPSYPEC
jgi:hypothetical protein